MASKPLWNLNWFTRKNPCHKSQQELIFYKVNLEEIRCRQDSLEWEWWGWCQAKLIILDRCLLQEWLEWLESIIWYLHSQCLVVVVEFHKCQWWVDILVPQYGSSKCTNKINRAWWFSSFNSNNKILLVYLLKDLFFNNNNQKLNKNDLSTIILFYS